MRIEPWIGVDLDGTLAHYTGWKHDLHIGEPIVPMLEFVKGLLTQGQKVKIFTARACDGRDTTHIQDWTEKHLGERLEITNMKDYGMVLLYDDRAVQVIHNTGVIVSGER